MIDRCEVPDTANRRATGDAQVADPGEAGASKNAVRKG